MVRFLVDQKRKTVSGLKEARNVCPELNWMDKQQKTRLTENGGALFLFSKPWSTECLVG
jgi:hypothetical protein